MHIYTIFPTEAAILASIKLAETSVVAHGDAIKTLIGSCESPLVAASEVIRFLITPSKKQSSLGSKDTFRVSLACTLTYDYPPAEKVLQEQVIAALSTHGFIPATEDLCGKLLSRAPTSGEVIALTKSYCDNIGIKGDHTEGQLEKLAELYGDKQTQDTVSQMLTAFNKNWHENADCY